MFVIGEEHGMSGIRSQQVGSSAWKRWAALSAATALALGLTIGAAAPSEAASRQSTSLTLTSITHVATKAYKGSVVVAGDKADLKGKASSNLVGKRIAVEIRDGSSWAHYPGSGTVSRSSRFSIRIRVTDHGTQTFRVVYAGSSSLKSATATKSVKVWTWIRLVELPVGSTSGSSTVKAAAHEQKNLVVARINRPRVLAGDVPAGGTGAASFDLGKHCRAFTTKVGVTDSSPAAGSITFSVYFDDVAEVVKEPKRGKTATIRLSASKVSHVTLRNTEPHPAGAFAAPVKAAWPDAQVLCDVAL